MTYASVVDAAIALISAALPGTFTTVADNQAQATWQPPDSRPACVLMAAERGSTTRRAQGEYGGYLVRTWPLEARLWADYPDVADANSFTALVDAVENVFRSPARLGGTADTTTTKVLPTTGEQIDTEMQPYLGAGPGIVTRSAAVRVRIEEEVNR